MLENTIILSEPFDLEATLESGQTFCWRRWPGNGDMFDGNEESVYYTVVSNRDTEPITLRVQQKEEAIRWDATGVINGDSETYLRKRLGIQLPFEEIQGTFPDDDLLEEAVQTHPGLRVPQDPPFPTLISFICSSQMRVERIHSMHHTLADEYGEETNAHGEELHVFPHPEQLSTVGEDDLRQLKLGYRADYVYRTTQMVASGEVSLERTHDLSYEDARQHLKQFVGVGDKVADCVLLFGFGFNESVPLDTWIQQALDEYYPMMDTGTYQTTSETLRQFFGPYAGHAQAYLFHHLRSKD